MSADTEAPEQGTDLVERLRAAVTASGGIDLAGPQLLIEAADEITRLRLAAPVGARPESEWHEDIGPVLWWKFPIDEPPYVGTPLDLGYIVAIEANGSAVGSTMVGGWPGYHTHWTPISLPISPPEGLARE